ncbi:MAG TPA: hypothetical protein ENK85_12000 [Saprospiraceae bacterium]|nr:hypothetical protein [Saprospiraceae bacterium]
MDVLVQYIEKCGGKIHLENKISSLIQEGNKIKAFIVNGEEKKSADLFISNIDPEHTLMMVDSPAKQQKKWYERSNSLLSFFIGCELTADDAFPFTRAQKWCLKYENVFDNPIFDKRRQDISFVAVGLWCAPSSLLVFGALEAGLRDEGGRRRQTSAGQIEPARCRRASAGQIERPGSRIQIFLCWNVPE